MNKIDRVNSEIMKKISHVITYDIENPILKDGLISIVRVDTDKDLTLSKVYYSVIGNKKFTISEIDKALISAKGFIKKSFQGELRIRRIPDIRFIYNDSMEYASKLEKILKEVNDGV